MSKPAATVARRLCPTCGSEPYAGHVLWCDELAGRPEAVSLAGAPAPLVREWRDAVQSHLANRTVSTAERIDAAETALDAELRRRTGRRP